MLEACSPHLEYCLFDYLTDKMIVSSIYIIYIETIETLDNMNNPERIRRLQIKNEIESQCMGLIEEKIDRYLEIEHQGIIGYHYFAEASSECIYLYRDGYFIATVMMIHAINEGIIKFIAERNGIKREKTDGNTKTIEELISELKEAGHISLKCANASKSIWNSYRNDVHHMNPKVIEIPFKKLAKKNIKYLSAIEKEIFGYHINKAGIMVLHQTKYWDIKSNGTTTTFLRLE